MFFRSTFVVGLLVCSAVQVVAQAELPTCAVSTTSLYSVRQAIQIRRSV
jgi:hypothetical protein